MKEPATWSVAQSSGTPLPATLIPHVVYTRIGAVTTPLGLSPERHIDALDSYERQPFDRIGSLSLRSEPVVLANTFNPIFHLLENILRLNMTATKRIPQQSPCLVACLFLHAETKFNTTGIARRIRIRSILKPQPPVLGPPAKGQGELARDWRGVLPWVDLVLFVAVPLWSKGGRAEGGLVEPVVARP